MSREDVKVKGSRKDIKALNKADLDRHVCLLSAL